MSTDPLDGLNLTVDQKADIWLLHLEKCLPLDDAAHKVIKDSLKAGDEKEQ